VTGDESRLWFEKAHRLEEDRSTLLDLLETLASVRMRLNGTAGGLAEMLEYRAIERRVMAELTALNERQNAYIAEMMAWTPHRDEESGHLGGLAGDLEFIRRNRTREAAALNGQTARVSGLLLADAQRYASEQNMSVRTWIESAIRRALKPGANPSRETLTERLRVRLKGAPASAKRLAEEFALPHPIISHALRHLTWRGLARYSGPHGSREHPWVSLEER
jgi:hypothetical protein